MFTPAEGFYSNRMTAATRSADCLCDQPADITRAIVILGGALRRYNARKA
jgi:hypothetical protein